MSGAHSPEAKAPTALAVSTVALSLSPGATGLSRGPSGPGPRFGKSEIGPFGAGLSWQSPSEGDAQQDDGGSRSTRLAVENRLGVHVYPLLGGKQLRSIKPSTMQAWLRSVGDLAPRTRLLLLGHVSAIFNAAVDDRHNSPEPMRSPSVRRPKVATREVVPWEHAQVIAVREALPEWYRVIAMLGAGLGLRHGEACGLSPDDIDWLRGTVQVRRQVKLIGPHELFGPPKYGREREVPLPESVKAYLATYVGKWPAGPITLPAAGAHRAGGGVPERAAARRVAHPQCAERCRAPGGKGHEAVVRIGGGLGSP
jgi:integrase